MIDFEPTDRQQELQAKTATFVREKIIPFEKDARRSSHGPTDELRQELVAVAAEDGLLTPHISEEYGGLGLTHLEKAIVFEEAGYSLLGPVAMNIAAPDEGNLHMLDEVASTAQKEKWLRPMGAGEFRSCFNMTEPAPGAGSDPKAMQTEAREQADGSYLINGRKWLITGADGAGMGIIMARTFDKSGADIGASMFLVDWQERLKSGEARIDRIMDTMDASFVGGHGETSFHNLRATPDELMGNAGSGFKYAQVRLAPARLTHCMRWLGAARRCHDEAVAYAMKREAFGNLLIDHEGVGFSLADNEIDMHTTRLAIHHAAWVLDKGEDGGRETSMVKVMASEAISRIVDRSLQVLGGLGITEDTEVSRIYREVRAFRIYDGPSEVHRWSLAKKIKRAAG